MDRLRDRLFGIDLRALALFRIALALLLLFDLASRLPLLAEFYTDAGVLPRALVPYWPESAPTAIHMWSGSFAFAAAFYAVALVSAVLLLLGLFTGFAKTFSYLHLLSLWWRNPGILTGGDVLLVSQLFWCLFLPLGARLSLDARRAGRDSAAPGRALSAASAALLLHPALFYFFSVFHKVAGSGWLEGTAVYVAVSHAMWRGWLGDALLHVPAALAGFAWATLAWEFAGPLLLFSPWRTAAARVIAMLGFAGLQLGLGLSIRLWLFPWIMTIMLIPFMPTPVLDALAARARRLPGLPAGPPLGLRRAPTALVAIALGYVVFSYVERAIPALPPPPVLTRIGRFFALNQGPVMYATQRPWDAELQVAAVRDDGVRETLDDAGATRSFAPIERLRSDHRGRRYLERLAEFRIDLEQEGFGRWVCREWNAAHPAPERVREVELVGVRRTIPLHGEASETASGVLRRVRCAPAANGA